MALLTASEHHDAVAVGSDYKQSCSSSSEEYDDIM